MLYNNYNEYKKDHARRRACVVTAGDLVKCCIFGFIIGAMLAY